MADTVKCADALVMVCKAFTIARAAFVGGAIIASAQAQARSGGVAVQAVVRATILRPAALRVAGEASRLELTTISDESVMSRRSVRACAAGGGGQCMLVVFDLP
jgi:hypothetical protein